MKQNIHNHVGSLAHKLRVGSYAIVLGLSVLAQSYAAVTWYFEEIGNNVVATASGSFDVTINGALGGTNDEGSFSSSVLYSIDGTFNYASVGAAVTNSAIVSTSPSSYTGNFGFSGFDLYWDASLGTELLAGTAIDDGGSVTITWANKDIEDLFGSPTALDTAVTAWSVTVGGVTDYIYHLAGPPPVVPEPSSLLLLLLGAIPLLNRRQRVTR